MELKLDRAEDKRTRFEVLVLMSRRQAKGVGTSRNALANKNNDRMHVAKETRPRGNVRQKVSLPLPPARAPAFLHAISAGYAATNGLRLQIQMAVCSHSKNLARKSAPLLHWRAKRATHEPRARRAAAARHCVELLTEHKRATGHLIGAFRPSARSSKRTDILHFEQLIDPGWIKRSLGLAQNAKDE